jgi:hypothetical protein
MAQSITCQARIPAIRGTSPAFGGFKLIRSSSRLHFSD